MAMTETSRTGSRPAFLKRYISTVWIAPPGEADPMRSPLSAAIRASIGIARERPRAAATSLCTARLTVTARFTAATATTSWSPLDAAVISSVAPIAANGA